MANVARVCVSDMMNVESMVKIRSVSSERAIMVPRDLISKHSPTIRRLIEEEGFTEADEINGDGEIPDLVLGSFDLLRVRLDHWYHRYSPIKTYLAWLYTGSLASIPEYPGLGEVDDREYARLCDLYCLGLYLDDRRFQNVVLDAVCAKNNQKEFALKSEPCPFIRAHNAPAIVRRSYSLKDEGRKLKDLLLTICAASARPQDLTSERDWPKDFVRDLAAKLVQCASDAASVEVAKKLSESRDFEDGKNIESCRFHLHDDREEERCNLHVHVTANGECAKCTKVSPEKKRKRVENEDGDGL